MIVFLDMDGVLSDFVSGICAAHGRPSPYNDPASKGQCQMEKLWDMSATKFWAPTNSAGFWINLRQTEEADDIVATAIQLFGVDNLAIATSPATSIYCVPEKREWIKQHYPFLKDRMVFTGAKYLLASSNKVLVDDQDDKVMKWLGWGGIGVLIPRPWNTAPEIDNPLEAVKSSFYHIAQECMVKHD